MLHLKRSGNSLKIFSPEKGPSETTSALRQTETKPEKPFPEAFRAANSGRQPTYVRRECRQSETTLASLRVSR